MPSREAISQYLFLYSISGDPGDFDAYVDYNYRRANVVLFLASDESRAVNGAEIMVDNAALVMGPAGA